MDTYAINDMIEFSKAMIEVLGKEHNIASCSNYITSEQFSQLVENYAVLEGERYVINEEQVCTVMKDAWEIVIGQILAKMASDDLLECAWDDETQDMIFWAKK